jgi:hypothetical protein
MNLNERIFENLKKYCHKLIAANDFVTLEEMTNFSNALYSGKW